MFEHLSINLKKNILVKYLESYFHLFDLRFEKEKASY
jgi:hypothetical protein